MQNNLINKVKDPMGAAIYDYYTHSKTDKLYVLSPDFEEDEIPVEELFRDFEQMSHLERTALLMARGNILDVGAGSGCHSLALKELCKDSLAIDISPLSVEVMKCRGVKARQVNFFDSSFCGKFDTILMLMNGIGIVGTTENLKAFFERLDQLLAPGGSVLMDSSDLRYLYEDEDGSFSVNLADEYYGVMRYVMKYKNIVGSEFKWLYIDYNTLSYYATKYGYVAKIVEYGEHYDFLAQLTRI